MPEATPLTQSDRTWLLALARRTLECLEPTGAKEPDTDRVIDGPVPSTVADPSGVFVTLHARGALRGCIGYVAPVAPLYRAVIENTVNAARRDPRFPPVTLDEAPGIDIEISVMTPPRRIDDVSEIEVGLHGLIIGKGACRGLLLPQVATEQGWDRDTFLEHTCRKASLPLDAWRGGDVEIEVFSADVFSEGSN